MSFKKQDIYNALESITAPGEGMNLIESKSVTNVVVFGKEILVDVTIKNPSLQAKKKIEVEIMKAIHDQVDEKTDVKVNVKVDAPAKPAPIRGNDIPGIKNKTTRISRKCHSLNNFNPLSFSRFINSV